MVGKVDWQDYSYRANLTSRLWMMTLGVRLWDKKS